VKFKVFGLMGATFIFSIGQGIWLMKNGEFVEETTEIDSETNNAINSDEHQENLSREAKITHLLLNALPDATIDLKDESHLHAGHAGAKDGRGHFRLNIISKEFENKRSLQRHQTIYQILGEMMQTDIHALAIDAKTPDEIFE